MNELAVDPFYRISEIGDFSASQHNRRGFKLRLRGNIVGLICLTEDDRLDRLLI